MITLKNNFDNNSIESQQSKKSEVTDFGSLESNYKSDNDFNIEAELLIGSKFLFPRLHDFDFIGYSTIHGTNNSLTQDININSMKINNFTQFYNLSNTPNQDSLQSNVCKKSDLTEEEILKLKESAKDRIQKVSDFLNNPNNDFNCDEFERPNPLVSRAKIQNKDRKSFCIIM